jgi:hypothetical protein
MVKIKINKKISFFAITYLAVALLMVGAKLSHWEVKQSPENALEENKSLSLN